MFYVTHGKGFQLYFPNGYGVSVQWGPMNYCDHQRREVEFRHFEKEQEHCGRMGSRTAETALFKHTDGKIATLIQLPWGGEEQYDTVQGYQTPNQVAELIAKAAALPNRT
jgi:hypothetical protein